MSYRHVKKKSFRVLGHKKKEKRNDRKITDTNVPHKFIHTHTRNGIEDDDEEEDDLKDDDDFEEFFGVCWSLLPFFGWWWCFDLQTQTTTTFSPKERRFKVVD